MSFDLLSLAAAAGHVHVDAVELRHAAQRGEVPSVRRGEEFFFEHRLLDEWAQRRMLARPLRHLTGEHREAMAERRRAQGADVRVVDLLAETAIAPALGARNRGGVLRDLTDLAESTGLLYDPEALFRELVAREDAGSTAMGGGAALPHPRFHDPYLAAESFVVLGRTAKPVYYGAQDGTATDLFFLVCCTDHRLHLHVLARLCLLVHGTGLLENLRAAPDAAAMRAVLAAAEDDLLGRI